MKEARRMSTTSPTSRKTAKAGKAAVKSTGAKSTKAAKSVKATKPRTSAASVEDTSAARKPAAKRSAKPAPKPAAAPRAAKTVNKPAKLPASPAEPPKPPKNKLVRDSFTMPKPEYVVIDSLKQRSAQAGRPLKKSEVLRAGVKALAAMADAEFAAAIANVQVLKTGRPKSKKAAEPDSLD
jgi:hypothetical protein